MPATAPRDAAQRKVDTLAALSATNADVWIATSSGEGVAHLVPLSLAWDGNRVILAIDSSSATARNLAATGRARLGVGPTRDVVMIDAVLESTVAVSQASSELADTYANQADWDPRNAPEGYVYVVLVPRRIMAWREVNELKGRTLMRDGDWRV